jgi:hypothetical protein
VNPGVKVVLPLDTFPDKIAMLLSHISGFKHAFLTKNMPYEFSQGRVEVVFKNEHVKQGSVT